MCLGLLVPALPPPALAQSVGDPPSTPTSIAVDGYLSPGFPSSAERQSAPGEPQQGRRLPDAEAVWPGAASFAPVPPTPACDAPLGGEPMYYVQVVDEPSYDEWVSEELASDEASDEPATDPPSPLPLGAFLGYRYNMSSIDWIFGDGDQFGMFSLIGQHYRAAGESTGVGAGVSIHFLDGPARSEMPPRLFDFSLAIQSRKCLGNFSYDVAASVMASGDFEASNREGILFPSHAVGFWHRTPNLDVVFGVDFLDRRDVALLPVCGLILMPHPDVRLELVFPRPRAVIAVTDTHRLYVRGELGGGTWDIFREDVGDDVATYRDFRLCVGLAAANGDHWQALEICYVFNRHLEYATGVGNYDLDDTAVIRLVRCY